MKHPAYLVNKSPTRCSLFHLFIFALHVSEGVVCKNCRGSHQCVSMRVVCVRWVRVGCPWGWCVYWWWTRTVSKTCRAKINKVKQAASRWWYIYKIVIFTCKPTFSELLHWYKGKGTNTLQISNTDNNNWGISREHKTKPRLLQDKILKWKK